MQAGRIHSNSASDRVLVGVCYAVAILFSLIVLLPFWTILMDSFSGAAVKLGSRMWVEDFSLQAYHDVLTQESLFQNYGNTIFSTVVGTLFCVTTTFMAAYQLFLRHLARAIEVTAAGVNLHIDHIGEVTPELVVNLLMRGPLETGEDISRCARLHTIGVDGCALAVVADSMAAIEQRVEQEKRLTWTQLCDALRSDFEGVQGERIRLMLSSAVRYCQGGTIADGWAERITRDFARMVHEQPMPEGRRLVPGFFSWSRTIEYGACIGATPNGRKAGKPISHGANPNPGFRKDGAVTALSTGIAHAQPGYGNAAPLQLEFDPKMTREEGGVERVEQLIRTHIDMGGTLININVLDGEKLMKAHENPDLYPDLVVRVTGFTAYFATLSPEFRQLVVDRFLEGL